jgi:NADP-reducing hydrogenase subunit HndD
VHRIKNGGALPMLTSCSPGWIKFVEQFYPDFMENLSTCKSPQQMLGAVIKTYFAEQQGLRPGQHLQRRVMPCTPRSSRPPAPRWPATATPTSTRCSPPASSPASSAMRGIDLNTIEPDTADSPLGQRSSAGKLFGVTGGVMEAALRTAHVLVTGQPLAELKLQKLRGLKAKEAQRRRSTASSSASPSSAASQNAAKLLDEIRAGRMTCTSSRS